MSKFTDIPQYILEEYFVQKYENSSTVAGSSSLLAPNHLLAVDGGYWTRLYVKIDDSDITDYRGFVGYRLRQTGEDGITDNTFSFTFGGVVDNTPTVVMEGETITAPTTPESGLEIYFRNDNRITDYIEDREDYKPFVNTSKSFLYFGKIFEDADGNYNVIFDNMKDWALRALPENNRTRSLKEFFNLYFDKVYSQVHNKAKGLFTLLDPKEIDESYLAYIAGIYSMVIDEDYSLLQTREWVDNLINLLKRKGTYTSIIIIWKLFTKNTTNNVNIYDMWHTRPPTFTIPLTHFTDVLFQYNYGQEPEGCSGYMWYQRALGLSDGIIHTQTTADTTWIINHEMYTKNVMLQCFDVNYNLIAPLSVIPVSVTQVYVTFPTVIAGYAFLARYDYLESDSGDSWVVTHDRNKKVITQFNNDDYELVIPNTIDITNNNYIDVDFGGVDINGKSMVLDGEATITQGAPATSWTVTHNLGQREVLLQFFDNNDEMINPQAVTLDSDNEASATFPANIDGYCVLTKASSGSTVLPTWADMMQTPHYKVEMDFSCEPLGDTFIVDQSIMDNLLDNWEVIRPVSRYAHYHQLVAPLVDWTGNYKSLYGSTRYNGYLLSKYVLSGGAYTTVPNERIHYQRNATSTWYIYHELSTRNLIIQCYDTNGYLIKPQEIVAENNNLVKVIFPTSISGVAYVTVADVLFIQTTPDTDWIVIHNLGTKEEISQYYDESRTKLVPNIVQLTDSISLDVEWDGSEMSGYGLIETGDYIHSQATSAATWEITHNLDEEGLIIQCFNNNDEMINPDEVLINTKDRCTVTFSTVRAGYAVLKGISHDFRPDEIIDLIKTSGTWKIGSGGGVAYNPGYYNDLQTPVTSGGSFEYDEDDDNYYLTFEATYDTEDINITEAGLFDENGSLRFYSYFSPIYKPYNVKLNIHYRITKDV